MMSGKLKCGQKVFLLLLVSASTLLTLYYLRVTTPMPLYGRIICTGNTTGRNDCLKPPLSQHNVRDSYQSQEISVTEKTTSATIPQDRPDRKPLLCFAYNGRLGNHLFEFASVYGIAHRKGMIPVIPENNILLNLFKLDIPVIPPEMCGSFAVFGEKRPSAFDQESVDFPNSIDIMLTGSYQSWRYFDNVVPQLRQQFRFRNEIVEKAQFVLSRSIVDQIGPNGSLNKTFVGIHIRRGDMLLWYSVDNGYQVATNEYFLHAMDFFRRRHKRVLFVICSDDMDWARFRLSQEGVVFVPPQEPEVDMATLALCNHTIMSVGSFGWWAAWLAGGTTIYYAHPYREGTYIANISNISDYVYPNWIAME